MQQINQKLTQLLFPHLSEEEKSVLEQLFVLNQPIDWDETSVETWKAFLAPLVKVDRFYAEIGGLIGYQKTVMRLLKSSKTESCVQYHVPSFIDLRQESRAFEEGVEWGIDAMEDLAEIYPLGGAADRLHLVDEETGQELPAAKLPFNGRPLLEGLIADLQARERLYYQKFGRQIVTPIAMMTSWEKNNHEHVTRLCASMNYWNRPPESFRFFAQPLVPAVDNSGKWIMLGPLKPLLKPGGHGVLWKLARDEGIFKWLASMRKTKAIIRQINNPAAGLDGGLLALFGIGVKGNYRFGFASCPRLVRSSEGVNVIIEKEGEIALTNVEYCELEKAGIEDVPMDDLSPYSRFCSNTNILFADLLEIEKAIEKDPFPGLLINPKASHVKMMQGEVKEVVLGRLESTMQNIADVFTEQRPSEGPLKTQKTFATYNERHKTIAVAKKASVAGKSLLETPEHCFFELLHAARELLGSCGFSLPPVRSLEESLKLGPSFAFFYHPALGPLYKDIRRRIRNGQLSPGAECALEIADLFIDGLDLNGSLQIKAAHLMGQIDSEGLLHYSSLVGKCILKNVQIENQGVDWPHETAHWKRNWRRKESLWIELKGHSIFEAENVSFKGSHHFVVEDGMHLRVMNIGGKLQAIKKQI